MHSCRMIFTLLFLLFSYAVCIYAQRIQTGGQVGIPFEGGIVSLEELCSNSTDILVTHVISKHSFKDPTYNRIYTEVQIQIVDPIKGSMKERDIIRLLRFGGSVDGVTTLVVGAPSFEIDKDSFQTIR